MADNTVINTGTGGDTIRDIDRAGVKTQVMQLDVGGSASESLVSPTNGIPTSSINSAPAATAFSASDAVGGAPDGNGTPINAASTAGSIVSIAVPAGMESWTLQVTSYGTGAIYTEGSIDSTNGTNGNWVALKGRRTGTAVGVESVVYTVVANGVYRGNCAGIIYLRARLIGTGTPSAKFVLSGGSGATFLNSGIPSGTSNIGTVNVAGTEATATFRGRSQTFRTPGLAGTAGQKLFAIHNATGSTKVVHINQVTVDLMQTVAKALTVAPPLIRIHRFTAIPTGGTAGAKTAKDTALTSNASITTWQGASADGTGTALTVTIPASSMITQEFAARSLLTGTAASAFYESFDRATYLEGYDVVLRALEGLVVNLDYTLATQNPATDMWTVGIDWYEV